MTSSRNTLLLAFTAGLACVAGFAPFGLYPVPVLALAVLFHLWLAAETPRSAMRLGYAFGLGLFIAGIAWIYVALHDYGGMPAPLAALATCAFAGFLAGFPALAGLLQARLCGGALAVPAALVVVMPALWVAGEWLRGLIFTGFPWLTLGYAHSDGPLAGYAPLLGVYGVSLAAAVTSGLLALLWRERSGSNGRRAFAALALLLLVGTGLREIAWTQPQGGNVSVALIQGNVAQDLKFDRTRLVETLETYRDMVLSSNARLIVLPETALPMLREEAPPELIHEFAAHAARHEGTVMVGAFSREGDDYHNSLIALTGGNEQQYHKQHLVPFGEFIPLRGLLGWIVTDLLQIPMGDLASGGDAQPLLSVAGQRVAANICYEDVFGEEIIRALPQATLLVNVTNDAWYGDSAAAEQHNQIARMRALETGRMLMRATNTGVTSIIGVDGRILQQLPQHRQGVLTGSAQGYRGATPYVRWGNGAVLVLLVAMSGYAWRRRRRVEEIK